MKEKRRIEIFAVAVYRGRPHFTPQDSQRCVDLDHRQRQEQERPRAAFWSCSGSVNSEQIAVMIDTIEKYRGSGSKVRFFHVALISPDLTIMKDLGLKESQHLVWRNRCGTKSCAFSMDREEVKQIVNSLLVSISIVNIEE